MHYILSCNVKSLCCLEHGYNEFIFQSFKDISNVFQIIYQCVCLLLFLKGFPLVKSPRFYYNFLIFLSLDPSVTVPFLICAQNLFGMTLISIFSEELFKFRLHDHYLCKISHHILKSLHYSCTTAAIHILENQISWDVGGRSRAWGKCSGYRVVFCFQFCSFLRKQQLFVTTFLIGSFVLTYMLHKTIIFMDENY